MFAAPFLCLVSTSAEAVASFHPEPLIILGLESVAPVGPLIFIFFHVILVAWPRPLVQDNGVTRPRATAGFAKEQRSKQEREIGGTLKVFERRGVL